MTGPKGDLPSSRGCRPRTGGDAGSPETGALASADLTTAGQALDNYRETLASAEVRMEADRARLEQLQQAKIGYSFLNKQT